MSHQIIALDIGLSNTGVAVWEENNDAGVDLYRGFSCVHASALTTESKLKKAKRVRGTHGKGAKYKMRRVKGLSAADDYTNRLAEIGRHITHVLAMLDKQDRYGETFRQVLAVEFPSGAKNAKASWGLALVAGLTVGIWQSELEAAQYMAISPLEAYKSIRPGFKQVKGGTADKASTQAHFRTKFPLTCARYLHALESVGRTKGERETLVEAAADAMQCGIAAIERLKKVCDEI